MLFRSDNAVVAIFQVSTKITIHDGISTSFWKSHWLQGIPLCVRFPALFKHSRLRNVNVRIALTNRHWISLIKPNPSLTVLSDYIQLWELLEAQPQFQFDDLPDSYSWRWTSDGQYTAASAYLAQFIGRIASSVFQQLWKTKATPQCRMHAWILLHNRCLTAENLAKRGWPHNPICSLRSEERRVGKECLL